MFGSTIRSALGIAALAGAMALGAAPVSAQTAAKELFGHAGKPADLSSRSIGSYARGCLAGAAPLPVDGPAWQVMRLSRNRNWGHPELIAYLEKLSRDAAKAGDWPGLLVGDMAQPRGGPMLTGHASHQIGLDADIWLTKMPERTLSYRQRENMSATSMLKPNSRTIDPKVWTDQHARILRRAASYPEVARIFVHPAIKKQLCDWQGAGSGKERAWLNKIRPWYGHYYHFHVRLSCPAGMTSCKDQAPPPPGDGCGKELSWWLGPEPWTPKKPSKKPAKPPRQITLADLPKDCATVLSAPAPDGTPAQVAAASEGMPALVPLPLPRPTIQ